MKTIKTLITALLLLVISSVSASNLAMSGTATASHEQQAASNAIDGNEGTRWETEAADPQWLAVTLDATCSIDHIKIYWEGASAKTYSVKVSTDSTNWTEVYSMSDGSGSRWDDITFTATNAKYIVMNGTERSTGWGYSIWELEVYEATADAQNANLSDLKVDGTTIDDFSSSTLNYDYGVASGVTTVPTVTATASITGADVDITPAESIPGTTTVLVTATDGTTSKTYNVYFLYTSPADAPSEPTKDAANVISVYSGAYDSNYTNLDPYWGQATDATEVDYSGNKVLKYADLNYQGMQYASTDASGMEYVHLDYWTSDATDFGFWVIHEGQTETEYNIASELGITTGSWTSIDIPLSHYTGPDLNGVTQFKTTGNGTIYLDNLYFWKEPVAEAKDATLSDLLIDGTTIDNFSSNDTSYSYIVDDETVPTTTATATINGAGVSISNASSIPGTTTVTVTSTDGTVTKRYHIEYIEQPVSEYCERIVAHFDHDADGTESSAIYLTISKIDETSFYVEALSYNGADSLDLLLVNGVSGFSSTSEVLENGAYKKTYTATGTVPETITMEVLWSKLSSGGNWMLSSFTVPFDAECPSEEDDSEAPTNFTASVGTESHNSVELLLSAEDNSGTIEYTITYGTTVETTSGNSGEEIAYEVTGLDAETAYTFSVEVKDAAGNAAANNPISLNATTSEAPSSEYCERIVSHFNHDSDGSQSSAIYLTISKIDETSFYVEALSYDGADSLDLLLVNGVSGFSGTTEILDNGAYKRTYTATGEVPDSVSMEILWSKLSSGGNWMLSTFKVPFDGQCPSAGQGVTVQIIEAIQQDFSVISKTGGLQIETAEPTMVNVYTISGQCIYAAQCDNRVDIELQKGIYIVQAGSQTIKSFVK